ncbi:hypothetical protein DID99_26425 [Burkholderia sp. Bp8986]|nr:hypothetical protein DIE20_31295 [Burkholderia sp. Bp9131]RQR70449.1 hypothetical protein DIE12_20875 [Burkholderia sp. Bp9015]RQR82254.1 hypothetical protein DIE10_15050 [Burkholderia sp. Bp9011]RQR92055.1 hypothetical protein DIE09_17280 [Burkholderia sp. Bp9010]RQS49379.1 hypothetical protein DID99_26425 [Burkholderia sp. Bp8986]RQS76432.1 hypothetical protein DID97_14855 [Burkholderia sp. Bp8977]RQZ45875.1 hypothetical protein DIE17_20075 [Burkholderia sp. Bp9099]
MVCGGVTSVSAAAMQDDALAAADVPVAQTSGVVEASAANAGADMAPVESRAGEVPILRAVPLAMGECAAGTPAAEPGGAQERNWPAAGAIALSDARLDAMRGGFDMPSGLKVSFGVSRVAFVNGNLVTTTSFNIPDISHITAQQAQALAAANAGALIQVGAGNAAQPAALPALTGAVIQNTLNNQQIQAVTTINTTVNTLSTFKNLNVMSTLNNALIGVLPGR